MPSATLALEPLLDPALRLWILRCFVEIPEARAEILILDVLLVPVSDRPGFEVCNIWIEPAVGYKGLEKLLGLGILQRKEHFLDRVEDLEHELARKRSSASIQLALHETLHDDLGVTRNLQSQRFLKGQVVVRCPRGLQVLLEESGMVEDQEHSGPGAIL